MLEARGGMVFGDNALRRDGRPISIAARAVEFAYDAVSYTHLRAHETVLDIVCRLLLEKKKNWVRQDRC